MIAQETKKSWYVNLMCIKYYSTDVQYQQFEYCLEKHMWADLLAFRSICDVKPADTLDEGVANTFMTVSQKCTLRNLKKRCSMNEVCTELMLYNRVYFGGQGVICPLSILFNMGLPPLLGFLFAPPPLKFASVFAPS
jgi:hypothetical protein